MLKSIQTNLGDHIVGNFDNYYTTIKNIMAPNYNVEYCDICSTKVEKVDDYTMHVVFKFVHCSVLTMATEPYWLITLKIEKPH